MDCCNYIEAYAAGGHFYQQQQQQQQYFCYDNGSAAYGGYETAPISNAIDINARYNGTIPSTYPGRLSQRKCEMQYKSVTHLSIIHLLLNTLHTYKLCKEDNYAISDRYFFFVSRLFNLKNIDA